ncbi:YitT family protein [Paenibacillus sp. y28]
MPRTRIIWFALGLILVSIALELLLKPNQIVPGGLQGIAILLAHATDIRLGLYLLALQLPLIWFARKNKKAFSVKEALGGMIALAGITFLLDPVPPLLEHTLAAAALGGLLLGIGAGLMIRYGQYSDGLHELAIFIRTKSPFSVAEMLLMAHMLIFLLAVWMFSWEQGLYSLIAFYSAYQSLRFMIHSRSARMMVWVKSTRPELVKSRISDMFGETAEWIQSPFETEQKDLLLLLPRGQKEAFRVLLYSVDSSVSVTYMPLEEAKDHHYSYLE